MARNEAATRVEEGKDARGVSVDGDTAGSSDDHRSRVRSWGHFCGGGGRDTVLAAEWQFQITDHTLVSSSSRLS